MTHRPSLMMTHFIRARFPMSSFIIPHVIHTYLGCIVSWTHTSSTLQPHSPISLPQVDVEGYEPSVVMSGTDLLRDRVQNILLEYSPGIYERLRDFEGLSTLPSSLASLLKMGFVAGHMPMRIATPWPPKVRVAECGGLGVAVLLPSPFNYLEGDSTPPYNCFS